MDSIMTERALIGPASGGESAGALGVSFFSLPGRMAAKALKAVMVASDALYDWRQRAYERKLLAAMGSRERADLGLSSASADRESAKPRWRG